MSVYNSRGNLNMLSGDTSGRGIYSVTGYIRVTIVDGTAWTGLYASDGSWNIVLVSSSATPQGLYHACGAYRVVSSSSDYGVYAPNGAYYADSSGLTPNGALVERDGDYILERDGDYIIALGH